jgi:hypothetical protein
MIALILTSFILHFLFQTIVQTFKISHSLEISKEEALEISEGYVRLQNLISKIDSSTLTIKKNEYNQFSSLDFKFNNDLDPDWIFSGYKNGRLEISSEGSLIFNVYSSDNGQVRSYLIFSNLKSFELKENLPFFLTLEIESSYKWKKEFVFFLSNRDKEAYPI